MSRPLLLLAIFFLVAACGDEQENNISPFPNSTNGDAGNNSTAPNNVDPDGGADEDAGDVVGNCTIQRNLGVIGDLVSADGEFDATGENGSTRCAADNPDGETDGGSILQFELDVPRRVTIKVDGVPRFDNDEPVIPPDPSWEVRAAPCDTGAIQTCSIARSEELELAPGSYFLVINGRLDSGGYRLEIESEELVCMPGEATCSNDSVERCIRGTAVETYPCFDGCSTEAICTGDTCTDIVSVTIDANGQPYTISGHRRAQSNTWTAAPLTGCELFPGDPSPNTDGVEVFVRVDGLLAGQTLTIDAERSDGNYAFFLLQDCAATSCLHAADFDANSENKTSWNVEADGSVVLVVEALGTSEREIEVDVSVTQ